MTVHTPTMTQKAFYLSPDSQRVVIEVAGRLALQRALEAWEGEVVEPTRKAWGDPAFDDDRAKINLYIQSESDGLGWQGSRFRWDGDFEWCGAFAAQAWAPFVRADLRKHYYASTYRLHRYGEYKRPPNLLYKAPKHPTNGSMPRKMASLGATGVVVGKLEAVLEFAPQEGDILVVNGGDRWGQHITVVERFDKETKLFHCVEGNATGRGPKGDRFQGVIRRTRSLAEARYLYRPGFDCLIIPDDAQASRPYDVWPHTLFPKT